MLAKESTHHIPPILSRASKTVGSHIPVLNSSASRMTFSAASPDGPAPMIHIRLWAGFIYREGKQKNRKKIDLGKRAPLVFKPKMSLSSHRFRPRR